MTPDPGPDRRSARLVVVSVLGLVLLLVAGTAYLATFPDAKSDSGPKEYLPSPAERAYADDPTDNELAEDDLPAPREDEGDWPPGVDCSDFGPTLGARDVYSDVAPNGRRRVRSRRPSASLDLGGVRIAHSPEFLCLSWVARRPPRVPMVIDLEIREVPASVLSWNVRITLEPDDRRFVGVSWPGVSGLRPRAARLDIVRRYGRMVLPKESLPHRLPDRFQFQVVSRSPLFRGRHEFFDCVPDTVPVPYPDRGDDYMSQAIGCKAQP
jgi:hypothetical protein